LNRSCNSSIGSALKSFNAALEVFAASALATLISFDLSHSIGWTWQKL
jgi:hypothetical protein